MRTSLIFPLTLAFLFVKSCLSSGSSSPASWTELTSTTQTSFDTEAAQWSLSTYACVSCTSQSSVTPPNSCGMPQEIVYGAAGLLGPSGGSAKDQFIQRWYQGTTYQANENAAMEFDLWFFFNSVPSSDPVVTDFISVNADIGGGVIYITSGTLINKCMFDFTWGNGVITKAMYKYHVRVLYRHYWPNELRIRIISLPSLPSTTFSFGVRNFKFYIDGSIPSTLSLGSFPCSAGKFWTGTLCGFCSTGPNCGACSTTDPTICTMCKDGLYDYGNADCKTTCPLPFKATTNMGYPWTCTATCPTSYFWYYNSACSSDCGLPYTATTDSNGLKICSNPCYYNDATGAYVNKYLYPDQSCQNSCPLPLVAMFLARCLSPCANQNDYLFKNGSCTSQCNAPLVATTVNNIKYCNSPCSGQYIYYDGSCSTQCAALMIKKDESADIKFCISPCANPLHYFYQVDQKCLPTCIDPYEKQQIYNLKICHMSGNMNLEQVQDTKDMVAGLTGANKAGAAGSKASASLSSTSPALAFLAGQVSMLFSIRYIDVGYPDKVKLMFKLQGASPFSLSINFEIPGSVERKIVKRTPPDIFEEYEMPPSFLENAWDTLLTLMLTLFSIGILAGVMKIIKGKCLLVERILSGILGFLKWNIPLMIFCSSFGDMYLFASLQFHSGAYGNTAWEVISFISAILVMLIGVMILLIPVKIARDIMKDKNSEKGWESFGLLYSGQKRNSIVSFCYMAFYLSVTILSNLIIGNFYAFPLVEAMLITAISVVMFLFLVIQRPLNEIKMFAQVVINQLLLVTVNICVVILAIMDELEIVRQDLRDKVGQTITMVFFCSMACGIAFVVIDVLFNLFYLYKFLKKFKAEHGTLSPSLIVKSLLSQEKPSAGKKLDVERGRINGKSLDRQSNDLSLVEKGRVSLRPPRKIKNPLRKNIPQGGLDVSYLDSNNTSGVELMHHQTIDYSFDLTGTGPTDFTPSKGRFLNQQQRKNMLRNVNRQVLNQTSDYTLDTLNTRGDLRPVNVGVPLRMLVQPRFENNNDGNERGNVPRQKRKTGKAASRSKSQLSPNSQRRKDWIQKKEAFWKMVAK